MTEAGADIVVAHMGADHRRHHRRRHRADAGRTASPRSTHGPRRRTRVRTDVIVLCHGGPIATPEDAKYILDALPRLPRLLRRLRMERLPTEIGAHRADAQVQADRRGEEQETDHDRRPIRQLILPLVVVAIVVAIAVWLLHWLYLRSSKERCLRAHRPRRPEGGARRRRLRAADRARRDPGQHEHAAPRGAARPRQGADHQGPDAGRRDRRVLRPRRDRRPTRSPRRRRRSACAPWSPTAEGAGRGQVRRCAAHRRGRDDDGGDCTRSAAPT